MKSRFFPRTDEVLLSMVTTLVIGGLVYQGLDALRHTKEHAIFQNNTVTKK